MSKYINLLTDFGFKKIFADPKNTFLLIDLLNTLLKDENQHIMDLTFLPNEQLGIGSIDRSAVFDLYCTNQKGEQFLVEVQRSPQTFFVDRTIYYSSFLIQNQALKNSAWNFNLKPVYCIALLNFSMPNRQTQSAKLYHKLQLTDVENGELFYTKMTYIYVELPKFKKKEHELHTHFEKWVYLLSHSEHLAQKPETIQETVFMDLLEKAELEHLSIQERRLYDIELKAFRDNYNAMEYAVNKATNEALENGIDKGRLESKREAVLIGFSEGLSISLLSKITRLTEEEVVEIIHSAKTDS